MFRISSLHGVRSARTRKEASLLLLFEMIDKSFFLILLGPIFFVCHALFFVCYGLDRILLYFSSLLFCLLFGLAVLFAEHWLDRLTALFPLRFHRMLSLFLLFFILVVGYLLLTSCLISAPMGLVLGRGSFSSEIINLFTVQNSNCALLMALVSWFRRFPPLLRKADGQPYLPLRLTDL